MLLSVSFSISLSLSLEALLSYALRPCTLTSEFYHKEGAALHISLRILQGIYAIIRTQTVLFYFTIFMFHVRYEMEDKEAVI